MPSGSCRTIWSSRWTASVRLVCSVSTTCLRDEQRLRLLAQLVDLLDLLVELRDLVLEQLVAAFLVLDLAREDDVDERRPRARPRIARPIASETNWRCRAWRFCSRCGSRLMRIIRSSAARGPQAISSSGASCASCRGRMRSATAMSPNGLAITVATPARLATSSSRPGRSAPPPASTIWSTWLYEVDVKKNCSARVTSSASVSMNGWSTSAS